MLLKIRGRYITGWVKSSTQDNIGKVVAHNKFFSLLCCMIIFYKLLVLKAHNDNVIKSYVLLLCRYAFVDVYATYWANLTTPCVSENLQSKHYRCQLNYVFVIRSNSMC